MSVGYPHAAPMLERWCQRALASAQTEVACTLWLHLAHIQRFAFPEPNAGGVSTLLCAELFLNANLDSNAVGSRQQTEQLGFLDTEIFELFHATRSRVYRPVAKPHSIKLISSGVAVSQKALSDPLGKHDMQLEGLGDVVLATSMVTPCRNAFPRSSGYAPNQWVLGRPEIRLPGSLLQDGEKEKLEVSEGSENPDSAMAKSLGIREAARVAQVRMDKAQFGWRIACMGGAGWLKRDSPDRDVVLEHVVSLVASTPMARFGDSAVLGRRWQELEDTWDGSGRFAPFAPSAVDVALADQDFAQWLSASVDSAPMEVNLNIGQLQFRQHAMTAVPREVLQLPEFNEVFPNVDAETTSLMWALVEKAPRRQRFRFAGLRYEFRMWTLEEDDLQATFQRKFPDHGTAAEEWISSAIAAVGELRPLPLSSKGASLAHEPLLFEVEVFRDAVPSASPVVHLYHVTRCGPRCLRSQVLRGPLG
ncbi:hypothetical protein AK812_SmicGene1817 [Symbiodinium microadriaticum]|uniref:Uncharacterized protein n=1 Tax=Symbiodinium microadriaticum TaxID=2951 RepID=A0A1Q9F2Y4_SYMMI|nr:hypothetical protein AK812_SmicGene1817 [Symbiodinium microadriaticum]